MPVLLFANKQDLMNAMEPEEIADGLNLNELPRTRSWHIQVSLSLSLQTRSNIEL